MASGSEAHIIVGGGLAGAKAAETLREEGFEGPVTLIGDEPERPYERPPLSKEYLRGERDEAPYVHGEDFYAANDIELLTSTRVTAIEPAAHEVVLAGGRRLGSGKLLLATGAEPRRLDVPGADLDEIHYLRTLAESARIGERFGEGRRLVVIGSGWIGAEIGASARQKGCEVTLVEMAALPLERVLGPELGRIYLDVHRAHGVEFLAETTLERFEGDGAVQRVVTSDGKEIPADLVVVGVGVTPRTELAASAGLEIDNGVRVDESLRTSDPDIFAAGDIANATNPFYGHPLRVEHWQNARKQGAAAAKAMLGEEVSFDEIPYFFSDQYETGMEYSGYATEWDEVVFRGDVDGREFIAFWVKDDRVVAGLNMNIWDVSEPIRELIRSRRPVDREHLVDPDVPLAEVAEAGGPKP